MKRKTEPETLTAHRIFLTAPDGSPRMELSIGDQAMPLLRMFDPAGTCRIELGLQSTENGDSSWPHLHFRDSQGQMAFEFTACDFQSSGSLKVGGQRVWDMFIDALQLGRAHDRLAGERGGAS